MSSPLPLDAIALPAGTMLAGKYAIQGVLGKPGGFGITYLAEDATLGTPVAIKELFPRALACRAGDGATVQPSTRDAEPLLSKARERFLEEARLLARFRHPNIVRVRDFFEAFGTAYLVMDYLDGMTLSAYLERQGQRLPWETALQLAKPLLSALNALHAEGVIHRDVDPHNIYVTRYGEVVLLDFGAAREAAEEASHSLSVVVKPGYAPYEQYASRSRQGPWTDVYAVAATLYRIIGGRVPEVATSRMMSDELLPLSSLAPDVPEFVATAVHKGLALRPDDRPQTATAFQALLEAPAAPAPAPIPPPAAPPPAPAEHPVVDRSPASPYRPKKRRPSGWAVSLVLFLAIGGMSVWALPRAFPHWFPVRTAEPLPTTEPARLLARSLILEVPNNEPSRLDLLEAFAPNLPQARITRVVSVSQGRARIDGNGAVVYTPTADYVGDALLRLEIRITEAQDSIETVRVDLRVVAPFIAEAPVLTPEPTPEPVPTPRTPAPTPSPSRPSAPLGNALDRLLAERGLFAEQPASSSWFWNSGTADPDGCLSGSVDGSGSGLTLALDAGRCQFNFFGSVSTRPQLGTSGQRVIRATFSYTGSLAEGYAALIVGRNMTPSADQIAVSLSAQGFSLSSQGSVQKGSFSWGAGQTVSLDLVLAGGQAALLLNDALVARVPAPANTSVFGFTLVNAPARVRISPVLVYSLQSSR